MSSSPKFITPLVDRCVIAGYSAAISCAVRGYPKVRLSSYKYSSTLTNVFNAYYSTAFSLALLPAKDYLDEK